MMSSSISNTATRIPPCFQGTHVKSCSQPRASRRRSVNHLQASNARPPLPAVLSQASIGSRKVAAAALRSEQSLVPRESGLVRTGSLEASVEYKQLLLFLALSGGLAGVTDPATALDMQSFGAIDSSQVIQFLVNNPFVTLGVAVAAYFIVPRLIRVAVKFVVVPVAIGGVGYLIVTNPSTSLGFAKSTVGCKALETLLQNHYSYPGHACCSCLCSRMYYAVSLKACCSPSCLLWSCFVSHVD